MKQILNGNISSENWLNVEVDFYKKLNFSLIVRYNKIME